MDKSGRKKKGSSGYKVKPDVLAYLKKVNKKRKKMSIENEKLQDSEEKGDEDTDDDLDSSDIDNTSSESASGKSMSHGTTKKPDMKLVTIDTIEQMEEDKTIEKKNTDFLIAQKLTKQAGNLEELIATANELLKGRGKVNFIAVKGSGRVSKVTPGGEFVPVEPGHDEKEEDMNMLSVPEENTENIRSVSDADEEDDDKEAVDITEENTLVKPYVQSMLVQLKENASTLRPYRCVKCRAPPFVTQLELDFHMKCHAVRITSYKQPEMVFACFVNKCSCMRKYYGDILAHINRNHPVHVKELVNTETFSRYPALKSGSISKKRRKFKSIDKKLKCSHCGKLFGTRWELKMHMDRGQGYEYQCAQCDYKTVSCNNMDMHVKTHSPDGFPCEECGKVFGTKHRLNAHRLMHDENRTKHKCDQCDDEFSRKDALRKHERRFHDDNVEKYKCPHCKYQSKMSGDMRKHISVLHEKRHRCCEKDCNFQTNSDQDMTEHTGYHDPENRYRCWYSDCYFAHSVQGELTHHMIAVHKTNYQHKCPVCDKRFNKKTPLTRHLATHSDSKSYKCVECSAAFTSHSSYYRHRNKTGHDKNREGGWSVPRNFVVQMLNGSSTKMSQQPTHTTTGDDFPTNTVYHQTNENVNQTNEHASDTNVQHIIVKAEENTPQVIYLEDCDERTRTMIESQLNFAGNQQTLVVQEQQQMANIDPSVIVTNQDKTVFTTSQSEIT